jgi:hypothetical protein
MRRNILAFIIGCMALASLGVAFMGFGWVCFQVYTPPGLLNDTDLFDCLAYGVMVASILFMTLGLVWIVTVGTKAFLNWD